MEQVPSQESVPAARGYQLEMLQESLSNNIIIALDTGSGKTMIAMLRMKHELEREPTKISWFFAPTVTLCEQQRNVIKTYLPVSVGLISGSMEPNQWKNAFLWQGIIRTHRIIVSTPQVFLDALRHGYLKMGKDLSLLIFDEAHHAVDNHPYNRIMQEFYFDLPVRGPGMTGAIVRPRILGLTASPIYGGNVIKAFEAIEKNLDSTIRSTRLHQGELAKFVHRPTFKHVLYRPPEDIHAAFSTNLAILSQVYRSLNIEDDPYVISLRSQLSRASPGSSEFHRLDQKLSKVISKEDSFVHKGLRDFTRTADDLLRDLGPWAADWYVCQVVEKAKQMSNPFNNFMANWKNQEKAYLLRVLENLVLSPVSYYPEDITSDSSDKVRVLVQHLLSEKAEAEGNDEFYSGLIFVARRDAVIALAEIIAHHPLTKDQFRVGILLGSSDSAYRHSLLDVTRHLVKESQTETLMGFKLGEKNLIISTSVAEEGIDIQACGSVVRWDLPPNMASWAQSRGRARRQRSTFTLMFDTSGLQQKNIEKWQTLEKEMVALYNDPNRDARISSDELTGVYEEDDEDFRFRIESTGALLTLHSSISHLSHFCAILPNTVHADNRPIYDIDPPDFQEGWHSFDNRGHARTPTGPWGAQVTLPRSLPQHLRKHAVDLKYSSRISAFRHVAFNAYLCLYKAGLLNENLLPMTSVLEPHLEEEVKALLRSVEKRSGTAKVSLQIDPWLPEEGQDFWWSSELLIDGLNPLLLFTRSETVSFSSKNGPMLYFPGYDPKQITVKPLRKVNDLDKRILAAKNYTRRILWCFNGSRMVWDKDDYSYLILPFDDINDSLWELRRSWHSEFGSPQNESHANEFEANAASFGQKFLYPDDIHIVKKGLEFGRAFRFVRWRYQPLTEDEEAGIREQHKHKVDLEITYPLLVVERLPQRTNFLVPYSKTHSIPSETRYYNLIPEQSTITLMSESDILHAFLMPLVFRFLAMGLTVQSFTKTVLASTALCGIPSDLLKTAISVPVSGEGDNYQRLETLGDTVLKFVASIQFLAEYPYWHEGYLTKKKDHAVSNVRLAKESAIRKLYRWMIRDNFIGRKWKPSYQTIDSSPRLKSGNATSVPSGKVSKRKVKKEQELSTKVLADVVESLIGAAYLHGGHELGYECAKFFDLGIKWDRIPTRIQSILSMVESDPNDIPQQLIHVEQMLGYTFNHKMLLIEALMHSSFQGDAYTTSYERMEFLGDAVLDMIVTDYLYRAPGKEYSPGHLHLRKSAVVNAHILAYVCLRCSVLIDASMPGINTNGAYSLTNIQQEVYLWQCLLHSSPTILDDQSSTFARFCRRRGEIESALLHGKVFPWAALTRLQAPKFFSDMVESTLGAVFLDSHGSLDSVQGVLRKLGIFGILERIVADDLDVLHPVSRLSLWSSKLGRKTEYKIEKSKGQISCIIMIDGKEAVRFTDKDSGKATEQEVRFVAAENAIQAFGLREEEMNDLLTNKRTKIKKAELKVAVA